MNTTDKILLISPIYNIGGISNWTKAILDYDKIINTNVPIIDFIASDEVNSGKTLANTQIFSRLLKGIFRYSPLIKKIKKQLKYHHYSSVHISTSASFGLIRDFLILSMAKKKGLKTILHFHFGRLPEILRNKGWENFLLKKALKKTDEIIVLDKASYDVLKGRGYLNVNICPNPLSLKVVDYCNNSSSIQRSRRMIMYAGHLVEPKGVLDLVKACKDITNIELHLYGLATPEFLDKIYQTAGDNNSIWLKIHGNKSQDEIIKKLHEAKLLVLPSYSEGFPNIIIESMASGCPIMATPVGAIPEMLNFNSKNPIGIPIKINNPKDIEIKIKDAFNNPEGLATMAQRAKEKVEAQYTMKAVWDNLIHIWSK